MRKRLTLAIILVIVVLVSSGCTAVIVGIPSSFDNRLNTIVQPFRFSLAGWELKAFLSDFEQRIVSPQPDSALNSQSVINYFSCNSQLDTLQSSLEIARAKYAAEDIDRYEAKINELNQQIASLKPVVEQTVARQINRALEEQGIYNPFGDNWFKIVFPPVNFNLEKPLNELIISPRDKIQRIQSVTLKLDIDEAQMEEIENSVDRLNVSALVVQIGGLAATYPTFVVNSANLRWTLDTAAHEWLHQYLAFKPLGFRYVLDLSGISRNYEIGTINETVANMVGHELGAMVYDRYYSQYQASPVERAPTDSGYSFNASMRQIRLTVDNCLAQGQVEQAEKYMQDQRQYLAAKGYHIRKLNQAYFAFYGTYADSPTSVDPIGVNLRLLRKQSPSIKNFLDSVSKITSSHELNNMMSR